FFGKSPYGKSVLSGCYPSEESWIYAMSIMLSLVLGSRSWSWPGARTMTARQRSAPPSSTWVASEGPLDRQAAGRFEHPGGDLTGPRDQAVEGGARHGAYRG